jgi:hypothetical protein
LAVLVRFLDLPAMAGGLLARGSWSEFYPGHMWFLYVLLILSFVLLPVFLYLRRPEGARLVDHCRVGLYWVATPVHS